MNRPNILWFFTDEQRADSLGAYGSPFARSPHADALAARGTIFQSAYTPSPVCAAARASILTGHTPSRTGVLSNHLPLAPEKAQFKTRYFVEAGYNVASFGKHHYNCRSVRAFPTEGGSTLDEFANYDDYLVPFDHDETEVVRHPNPERLWLLAGRHPAPLEQTAEMRNVREALQWLGEQPKNQPWFLRVSQNAPHTPVLAPSPFFDQFAPGDYGLPVDREGDLENLPAPITEMLQKKGGIETFSDEQIYRLRAAYFARCAFVDATLGALLEGVGGQLDNTIIVFCSDHGTHLGDHVFLQKQSFYEASARVPFIVAGPGIAQGSIHTPVSLGGLLPTLLDLCGIESPSCDYASLAESFRTGSEPDAQPIVSEIDFGVWNYRSGDCYAMVRHGDWKLAGFRDVNDPQRIVMDESSMLYNLKNDPHERHNLALDAQSVAHCAALQIAAYPNQ